MLRYTVEKVRRLPFAGNHAQARPFPGLYPTRLLGYTTDNSWSYLGKPTPAAWRAVVQRTWDATSNAPRFMEFDRAYVVRRYQGEFVGPQVSSLMYRYYCADNHDLMRLTPEQYWSFTPRRLREGSIYHMEAWEARIPEFSRDDWFAAMRDRIRGRYQDLFPRVRTRAAQVAVEVPPPAEGNRKIVQELFAQLVGKKGAKRVPEQGEDMDEPTRIETARAQEQTPPRITRFPVNDTLIPTAWPGDAPQVNTTEFPFVTMTTIGRLGQTAPARPLAPIRRTVLQAQVGFRNATEGAMLRNEVAQRVDPVGVQRELNRMLVDEFAAAGAQVFGLPDEDDDTL